MARYQRTINKIVKKNFNLIKLINFTLLNNEHKEIGKGMYFFQKQALMKYLEKLDVAHRELLKDLKP